MNILIGPKSKAAAAAAATRSRRRNITGKLMMMKSMQMIGFRNDPRW